MSGGSITNSSFIGTIRLANGDSSQIYYAGGMAAVMAGGNIENCSVTSDGSGIYSHSPYNALSYGGGIVAYASIANFEAIKGCTFLGKVNSPIAGGIVGYIEGGSLQNNTVTADANASSCVSGSSNAGGRAGSSYAGGIAGQIGASTILEDCKVSSLVTVEISSKNAEAVGGIVGLMNASTVRNNQSYATISGDIPNMGGVVGKLDAASYTITNNRYSSAEHGIGSNAQGVPSEEGCIKAGASIAITTASPLTQAVKDSVYSVTLTSDSSSSVVWSLTNSTALPAGLTLDRITGTISGTPTTTGTYSFTVKASPASGAPATKEFTLTVTDTATTTPTPTPTTSITITTTSLPS